MSWVVAVILPLWALGLVSVYSMCRIPHPPVPGSLRRRLPVKSGGGPQTFRSSGDSKTLATQSFTAK